MPAKPSLSFGPFTVTNQVFHFTPLSFALVNIRPLLPGHVLVCPRRIVPRYSQLTIPETTDLFLTVRRVSSMLERVYKADALNIAIQDGKEAGQSVAHLHVHIIPRRKADTDDKGGGDAIYEMMEGEDGNLGEHYQGREKRKRGPSFAPDAERKDRTEEEMTEEADLLRSELAKEPDE